MPTFIDRHPLVDVPSAVRQQMHLEAVHGLVDPSGTVPLSYWIEDGYIYCVVRAPDEQAVCKHHAERGLACDELHSLPGLQGSRPLSGDDNRTVRTRIAQLWHAEPTST